MDEICPVITKVGDTYYVGHNPLIGRRDNGLHNLPSFDAEVRVAHNYEMFGHQAVYETDRITVYGKVRSNPSDALKSLDGLLIHLESNETLKGFLPIRKQQ